MDKRRSVLNVSVSVISKVLIAIAVILVRRILIDSCGNDVNGLNSLYLSIIGFLAISELGIGSAITFCMYEPIVKGENEKVSALYFLFRRLYFIVGCLILSVGLIITPFITYFAKDYGQIETNFYLTFVLMLLSVVLTYFFGAKTSLFNAYKNNYIATAITSAGTLIQYFLQIVVLIVTKSFELYLLCRIIAVLIQWIITEIISRKKYSFVILNRKKVDSETKNEVIKNIKAMFLHNIGYVFVNSTDSIIISAFIGVAVLGKYSNYMTIMLTMMEILKLIFTSLTSVFGHLYVEEGEQVTQKYCETFHLFNFIIATVFFLGYYAVIDNLIEILFSAELIVSKPISFVITFNGFVQFMRQSTITFRNATGTFYNDRWKPLIEGITNIILSVMFVKFMGIVGVIVATIITNLFICHIVEPYVLYKNAFLSSPKQHYFKNYSMIFVFVLTLVLLDTCMQSLGNAWLELLANGSISVALFSVIVAVMTLCNRKRFKFLIMKFKGGKAK